MPTATSAQTGKTPLPSPTDANGSRSRTPGLEPRRLVCYVAPDADRGFFEARKPLRSGALRRSRQRGIYPKTGRRVGVWHGSCPKYAGWRLGPGL